MGYAAELGGLVAGAGVDINTNAREVAWQGFRRDANAIGKSCDLVKFDGILAEVLVPHLI